MSNREDKILEIMHRLALPKTQNSLNTYTVLDEIWDSAYEEGYNKADDDLAQQGI